jgi:hypothetical protein
MSSVNAQLVAALRASASTLSTFITVVKRRDLAALRRWILEQRSLAARLKHPLSALAANGYQIPGMPA